MQRFGLVMPEARRRLVAGLCLALVAVAGGFLRIQSEYASAGTNSLARIGYPLPSLTVENSDGVVDLNTFVSGTRSIIVFYSPSCKTCKRVLPALRPFPDMLRLILINVSPHEGNPELPVFGGAARFYDRRKILSRSFAAAGLPTILFVDEAGILRDGIVGLYGRGFVQRKLKDFAKQMDWAAPIHELSHAHAK
jgi:thiol-disulfide isomerase/thioredoxin